MSSESDIQRAADQTVLGWLDRGWCVVPDPWCPDNYVHVYETAGVPQLICSPVTKLRAQARR